MFSVFVQEQSGVFSSVLRFRHFVSGHPLANPDPTIAESVTISDNYVRDCARYARAITWQRAAKWICS